MRNRSLLAVMTMLATISVVACKPEEKPEESQHTQAAPPTQPAPSEPKRKAPAKPKAVADEVKTEPKKPLRFDMVQQGERQSSEDFEKWMEKNGVRVAGSEQAEEMVEEAEEETEKE